MKLFDLLKNKIVNFVKYMTSSNGDVKSNLDKYSIYFIIVVILNILVGKNITHMGYPWYSNVSMFLLLNINIILVIILLLLIFRNLVKILSEKRGTLKIKLLIFSLIVSILPVTIIFIYSSQLLNNSINKWFTRQADGIVNKAYILVNDFRQNEQNNINNYVLYFYDYFKNNNLYDNNIIHDHEDYICNYVYKDILSDILIFDEHNNILLHCNNDSNSYLIEKLLEYDNGFKKEKFIYGYDNISRGIHFAGSYIDENNHSQVGFLLMKQTSIQLYSDVDNIKQDLDIYNQNLYFAHPIKNSSILQLLQISLLLLFSAIWVSMLFARSITKPIEELAKASKKISSGNFDVTVKEYAGGEIGDLVSAFNSMTDQMKKYTMELSSKNVVLSEMFEQISRDNMYIDAIFKNVDSSIILLSNDYQILKSNIKADIFISKYRTFFDNTIITKIEEFMHDENDEVIENIEIEEQNGNKIYFMSISKIILIDEEQVLLMLGDVTDIVDAQKIALWKDIATRIAHEVKNPLTPIKLMAERVKRRVNKINDDSSREMISESMDIIIAESDNLKELIEEFNMFARLPKANLVELNLYSLIKDTVLLYQETYHNIKFFIDCNEKLELNGDRLQLRRVFQNIISNAILVIGNNEGKVNIIVTEEKDNVVIIIKDTGKGINESYIPNLFKPYFSKRQGGTGLGLAIVKKIVEEHSGTISAGNNTEGGAYFKIILPRGIK